MVFVMQMKTAKQKTDARGYISGQGLVLTVNRDRYINTTHTERYIPPQNNNSGKRGGTTVNRSGNSHRGGKF